MLSKVAGSPARKPTASLPSRSNSGSASGSDGGPSAASTSGGDTPPNPQSLTPAKPTLQDPTGSSLKPKAAEMVQAVASPSQTTASTSQSVPAPVLPAPLPTQHVLLQINHAASNKSRKYKVCYRRHCRVSARGHNVSTFDL